MSELHEAASTGDLKTLEDHLSKGLDPNEPDLEWGGRTPLHIASGSGHKRCVHALLTAGAKVNVSTESGWTPAHCACETGQVQCLKSLLSAGCDVNATDCSGDTAKRIAEIYGQTECLLAIEEHNAKMRVSRDEALDTDVENSEKDKQSSPSEH